MAESLTPKPAAAAARRTIGVTLGKKRYELNIAVTANEIRNQPAELIELPIKDKPAVEHLIPGDQQQDDESDAADI